MPARSRRWTKLRGLAPPSKLGVFNNTVEVAHKALAERYFRCKVGNNFERALPTTWETFFDPQMRAFLENVIGNLPELVPPISAHEVADCYSGTKRMQYHKAAERYLQRGLTKDDARLQMFVKFEKGAVDKAPRVINPRSREYNVALGKYLKRNEHKYFEAIARVFGQAHVVIKGMNAEKSAEAIHQEWSRFRRAIGIGGDASKFDMHVTMVALMFEHLFYLTPLVGSVDAAIALYERIRAENHYRMDYTTPEEELAWLLVQQLDNRGAGYFPNGKVTFHMQGTRASGDLNTSLGNCILMCAMTWSWSKICDVFIALLNNGDDCDYLMEAEDEDRWRAGFEEYFRQKGFRMVLEPTVDILEKLEFCQSHPVNLGDHWTMMRNPVTLVTKGSMCLLPVVNEKQLRKWMMAIGVGEGTLGKGLPVIQSFAAAMRRNGIRCSQSMIDRAYAGTNRMMGVNYDPRTAVVTPQCRSSFFLATGIDPAAQIALEEHYDNWHFKYAEQFMSAGDFKRAPPCELAYLDLLVPPV